MLLAGRIDLILKWESRLSKEFTLYFSRVEDSVSIAMGLQADSV
jgi:hypothetical protein